MRKWTILTLTVLSVSSVLFAIDFETIFRDLDDPVEVVFVMDTSGSMGGEIAGVRDNVIGFAEALEDSGYAYRFGATTFGDGTNTWDFDTISPGFNMTPDVDTFRAQVAVTGATGGADIEETQIDGIYDAATLYDWAPGTLHVMIMFTNSGFHYPGDGDGFSDVTHEELMTFMLARGFLLYTSYSTASGGYPHSDSIYDLIADTTGGCSFDLGSRSPTSWDTILNYVRGDIMNYYSLTTRITGLAGHNLDEIELELLPEFTTFGTRVIDLSGPEYVGVDEIYIAWTMHLTGPPAVGSPYSIALQTDIDEYLDYGELDYKTPLGIGSGINSPEDFTISAFPNPFNSAVIISLSVIPGLVRNPEIEIYDLNGRIVETLAPLNKGGCPQGTGGILTWQPDASLGSGVYLVRARLGEESTSKRIVYLK